MKVIILVFGVIVLRFRFGIILLRRVVWKNFGLVVCIIMGFSLLWYRYQNWSNSW